MNVTAKDLSHQFSLSLRSNGPPVAWRIGSTLPSLRVDVFEAIQTNEKALFEIYEEALRRDLWYSTFSRKYVIKKDEAK